MSFTVEELAQSLLWLPDGHGFVVPVSTPAANAIAPYIMRLLNEAWAMGVKAADDSWDSNAEMSMSGREELISPYDSSVA